MLFVMSKARSEVMSESKRKGMYAAVAGAATVGLAVVGAVAAAPAALLTYKWWKHRAENGIKF
jgi:hypothetical protein